MFNPIRVLDPTFGHGTGMVTTCTNSTTNIQVYNLSELLFATVGDIYLPHLFTPGDPAAGIPPHPTAIVVGSSKVFIKEKAIGLAGPSYPLVCSDFVVPNPASRVFIGM